MTAERTHEGGRSYALHDDAGAFMFSLTFRDVIALVAVREGKARARWRHRYSYGCRDSFIHPECDFYGVGYGTLSGLQHAFNREPLVTTPEDEAPLALTPFGEMTLAAVLALPGVNAEAVAA